MLKDAFTFSSFPIHHRSSSRVQASRANRHGYQQRIRRWSQQPPSTRRHSSRRRSNAPIRSSDATAASRHAAGRRQWHQSRSRCPTATSNRNSTCHSHLDTTSSTRRQHRNFIGTRDECDSAPVSTQSTGGQTVCRRCAGEEDLTTRSSRSSTAADSYFTSSGCRGCRHGRRCGC